MNDKQAKVFTPARAYKWRFDGHGLNCDSARCLTAPTATDSGHRGPFTNAEFDALGESLAAFANQAHRLSLQTFYKPEDLPTIHLNIDIEDIRKQGVAGLHVIAVIVKLPNGKEGRVHLCLDADENQNRVRVSMRVPHFKTGDYVVRTAAMKFEDWNA